MKFNITKKHKDTLARRGVLETPHGTIQTPAFAVVGTKATVKGVLPEAIQQTGAQVVLANTYHLYLQPGDEIVKNAGGVGDFMGWSGPTITDSGGFQVFSLGEAYGAKVSKVATGEESTVSERKGYPDTKKLAHIDEEGVTFRSHRNGEKHRLTPERSMEIQWNLGADIIFAFDECTSPRASYEYQKQAMERTHRWAKRSLDRHGELDQEKKQALFGVVQGGRYKDLREESAKELASMQSNNGEMFDGFGVGGSFDKEDMATAVGWVNSVLPEEKPRHLLGIGEPTDIVRGVQNGCDLFDCVAPTRIARHGSLYTKHGIIHITNSAYRDDHRKIEETCTCYTCTRYSRAYLAHLFHAKEMVGATLASIHNIQFTITLLQELRNSIEEEVLDEYAEEFIKNYTTPKAL